MCTPFAVSIYHFILNEKNVLNKRYGFRDEVLRCFDLGKIRENLKYFWNTKYTKMSEMSIKCRYMEEFRMENMRMPFVEFNCNSIFYLDQMHGTVDSSVVNY